MTTLIEKSLDFEVKPIDLMKGKQKSIEYLEEKHLFGVIPVLIDTNGYKIYESRAICRYLKDKYKGHGTELIPSKDIKAQSLFEQAASIETSYFDPYASKIVFERVFKQMMHLGNANEDKVNDLKAQLNNKLDVYEKILSQQSYLAGQTFTLADLFHLPYGTLLS